MKTILAPVDFSGVTSAVIDNAVALAQAVGGRTVVLHVVPPPISPSGSTSMVLDLSQVCTKEAKSAASRLARLKSELSERGAEIETVEAGGLPTLVILEQAQRLAADYIVMGSHGHGAIYDLLIGGTTHAILKRARCPVVVVPALREAPPARLGKRHRSAGRTGA